MSQSTTAMIKVAPDVSLETIITTPSTPSPALLFLPFWGGSARTFSVTTSLLASKFSTIAISLRGWGASSKPDDPSLYSLTIYVSDICNLINNLATTSPDLFAHGLYIVGHSMGGKLAQILLTRQTDLAVAIEGLILIAPAPSRAFELPTEEMRLQQMRAYHSRESAEGAFKYVLLGRSNAVSETSLRGLVEDACGGGRAAREFWPSRGMGEGWEETVATVVSAWKTRPLRVMVALGELDKVETPGNVEEKVVSVLRRAGADVCVTHLAGVGHLIPSEAPAELATTMQDFLKK